MYSEDVKTKVLKRAFGIGTLHIDQSAKSWVRSFSIVSHYTPNRSMYRKNLRQELRFLPIWNNPNHRVIILTMRSFAEYIDTLGARPTIMNREPIGSGTCAWFMQTASWRNQSVGLLRRVYNYIAGSPKNSLDDNKATWFYLPILRRNKIVR